LSGADPDVVMQRMRRPGLLDGRGAFRSTSKRIHL
jgi:hypothetical protein